MSAGVQDLVAAGVHDFDEATYHGDPCAEPSLSSSIAKILLNRSPRHAFWAHPRLNPGAPRDYSARFDLGSAFHTLFLHSGTDVVVVDATDWRTKAAREARDDARAAGKVPLLAGQAARAATMVARVREQLADHAEARAALASGLPERSIVWQEDNGVWCRSRIDWLPAAGACVPDLKTTEASASPDEWGRSVMFNTGYDVQAAFYARGLRRLGHTGDPYVLFVVAEVDYPHMIATHRLSPSALALADRKVDAAVELWGACLAAKSWPGYRTDTAWHDAPPWHETQWLDKEFAVQETLEALRA